jgi:nanoRNase/pAp phosphatase (c-di-AMP/oligoRNAs hydrolase)
MADKDRLETRSDYDGLVSAMLLKELDVLDEIKFVHPKDVQDGKVDIGPKDITTNLPFSPGVHLAFDHHSSEARRLDKMPANYVNNPDAPSAARVVYDHYGGPDRFPSVPDGLLEAVDKADSAKFTRDDILNPDGWVLLSFLMDPRTGLGRFHHFRISNYDLMMELISMVMALKTAEQVLEHEDVKERVELYRESHEKAKDQLWRVGEVSSNLLVLDLREEDTIWPTNRFTIYALFPEQNISMHIVPGKQNLNTVFAIGKSVLKRTSRTNVGELCLEHGGGGHNAAGTCQVDNDDADRVRDELISRITADG